MRSVLIHLLRALFRLLFRVKIQGQWPTFSGQRTLIIANHESFLDGVLLGLFLPVNAVFVVHTTVPQKWYFALVLQLVDYLAVDPTSPMAIKHVVKLVESGRPVVIFPEGRITETGSLMKVYDGPAFVAARTGATVLPIRLEGPSRSYFSHMGGNYPRRWFPAIQLTVMALEQIHMPQGGKARERRRLAGEALRRIMQHMLFASRPIGTLFEALLDAAAVWGRTYRLLEDMRQEEYSYGDLLKMSLALGRLVSRISRPGERIGLLMPNMAPSIALLLGCSLQQRVPALLNYTAGLSGLDSACQVATLQTIITSRAFVSAAQLESVVASLAAKYRVVYLEDLRAGFGLTDKLWLLAALCAPRRFVPAGDPQAPAVVLFTSGSEGVPKGVVLTHQNLLTNMAQIRAVIDFAASDKFLNALPIFHAFGLTAGTLLPLITGTKLFIYPSPLHYRVIPEVAYDRNCTVLFGTSTFLANYARFAHPYDFYRIRYVVAGAERLSPTVRELWVEKFGIRLLEGYGATETAPVLAVNTPMAYKSGTVGQFLPGIEWWLEPVPGIDDGGLLHVRGPNVMAGYLRLSAPGVLELTASSHGPGWYATGDIVSLDAEGFVTIKGRLKRFAKIAGEMVSLESAEKLALLADPAGQHAASSRADPLKGEAIVLFTTNPQLTVEQLAAQARAHSLPPLATPRDLRVVAALPLLGTGKTDYVTLKQWAEQAPSNGIPS